MRELLMTFLLLSGFGAIGQNSFPDNWVGNYEGALDIFGVDSITMHVGMKLSIAKKSDSIYKWKMTYSLKDQQDERDYEMIVVNREQGRFDIDEKNSIIIDGYYRSGIYTSIFEVQKNMIIASYSKKGERLLFEIISANVGDSKITGNSKMDGKSIPEVRSFLVNGRQKCILKRVD